MEETGNLVQSEGVASDILAPNTRSLVAIAAAASANCHPCLRYLIPAALRQGVLEEEIGATLALAEEIKGRASKMTHDLAVTLAEIGESPGEANNSKGDCHC
ncbi:MAG: carboxymuconolactone decarboxylase family protein [Dehalococcoidia bacterium]